MIKAVVAALLVACAGTMWSDAASAASGTRSSGFAYDTGSGLLTQEVVEPGTPSLRLQTDYVYDAFGNKTSATVSGVDIVTRSATTVYDAQGRYAVSATNALGQTESWQYDARFGLPTSHTGPNGLTTTWSYDGFGRKTQEVRADGTISQYAYLFCSGINGGTASCPAGAVRLSKVTSFASNGTTQNAPIAIVYFDTLDREVARDTEGFDGSIVRAAKQYDSLGRVWKVSRPYFVSGGTPQWTTYTYDALGRVTQASMPDSSTVQNAYHGLTTVETNALSQTRTVTKNSQGDIVSVTDALNQTMTHAYDPFGKLIQSTDSVGNVVTAAYNVRGHRIASSDPNLGAWTYITNVLGEVVSQTDAKSQTVTVTYDKLGRMLQRVEPDMTSQWSFDTATNGIGKLASASITAGPGTGYQRDVAYDTLGRPVQVATTIDSSTYTMTAAYDANSRLSQVTYPSGFVASYGYNSLGYANNLADAGNAQTYWTANAIDAEQHLTFQTAGNGVVTTRSFSATNGRLQAITAGPSSAVQNVSYTYDLVGNPLSRADGVAGISESFTYDPLNRLLSATVSTSAAPAKSFTYDAIGNMLSKSDVGTYTYAPPGSPRPHAVVSISGSTISTTFAYDPNGNQTSGLGRTITWTSYNKPASITQGTNTVSFLDDFDHQRFKQIAPGGTTTLYISAFGVSTELVGPGTGGAKWSDYLSVGNVKVGVRFTEVATSTVSTRYFHTDHLGSIAVITNESAVVVERLSHDVWGKRRFPNGADDPTGSIESLTTKGFTGHEELEAVALVHMNGRVYDPLVGRMISADPIVPDTMNAQAWNRYSYVGNDPLAFTDPSGHSWLSKFFHSVGNAIKSLMQIPIIRAITQIVITTIMTPFVGMYAAAAIGAAIVTGLSGGKLGDMLKAAAIAGATTFAMSGLGAVANAAGGPAGYALNVAGNAGIGCLSSVASGGSCESGALSGAVSAAGAPIASNLGHVPGLVANATLGGLASVAGGGKFANGAVTGAFSYLVREYGSKTDGGDDARKAMACGPACPVVAGAAVSDALFGTAFMAGAAGLFAYLGIAPTEPSGQILHHYTTAPGMAGIVSSGSIWPSLLANNPNDARYGDGVYLTDIAPGTMNGAQLSRQLVLNPFQANKFTHFVSIDVRGLPVTAGRPHVFVIPTSVEINIRDRIKSFGPNGR